jgi:serine/threonine protein kinase
MSLIEAISHLKSNCNLFEQLTRQTNDCEWILQSKVGEGVQAQVYKVCCRQTQDCNYIAKIYQGRGIDFLTKLKNEIKIQQIAARISVAPFIVDGFVCNNEAIIVMKKADFTVKEYVKFLYSNDFSQDEILKRVKTIENEVVKLVDSLHEYDILHDDLHIDNMMVNVKRDDPSFDIENVKIIDFGKSSFQKEEYIAKVETPKEIEMSFNLLRSMINEGKLFQTKAVTPIKKRRPSIEDDDFGTPIRSHLSFGDDEDEKSTPTRGNLSDRFEQLSTPRKAHRSPPPAPRKKR